MRFRRNPDATEVRVVVRNAGKTIREAYAVARKAGRSGNTAALRREAGGLLERLAFYSGYVNAALSDHGFGGNLGVRLSSLQSELDDARLALRDVIGTKHPFMTTKRGKKLLGKRR